MYERSLIDMSAPELIQVNLNEALSWEVRSAARQKPLWNSMASKEEGITNIWLVSPVQGLYGPEQLC